MPARKYPTRFAADRRATARVAERHAAWRRTTALRQRAQPFNGGINPDMVGVIRSFDGLHPDDFLETYELLEDALILAELAADHASEFTMDDL